VAGGTVAGGPDWELFESGGLSQRLGLATV